MTKNNTGHDTEHDPSPTPPLLKMLAWRETLPSSHFTVSAAIHHRVKVKVVLWKQTEEGKITERYFRSRAL